MIKIKNKNEIEAMRHGGKILAEALFEALENVKPGISELELDKITERLIVKKGGQPGFKRVEGYKHTICISVNDVVVHGIPTDYKIKEGDVVGIDCGVFYDGFHTDMAETIIVSAKSEERIAKREIEKFLKTGKKAMTAGIKTAMAGNHVGHISKAIQDVVEGAGYSVVESLVGHGVGRDLHEDPEIPGFLIDDIEDTPLLKPGMTIAVEAIYNMGKKDVVYGGDNWTIKTADKSLSGLFERTIVITENDPVILTS